MTGGTPGGTPAPRLIPRIGWTGRDAHSTPVLVTVEFEAREDLLTTVECGFDEVSGSVPGIDWSYPVGRAPVLETAGVFAGITATGTGTGRSRYELDRCLDRREN